MICQYRLSDFFPLFPAFPFLRKATLHWGLIIEPLPVRMHATLNFSLITRSRAIRNCKRYSEGEQTCIIYRFLSCFEFHSNSTISACYFSWERKKKKTIHRNMKWDGIKEYLFTGPNANSRPSFLADLEAHPLLKRTLLFYRKEMWKTKQHDNKIRQLQSP